MRIAYNLFSVFRCKIAQTFVAAHNAHSVDVLCLVEVMALIFNTGGFRPKRPS